MDVVHFLYHSQQSFLLFHSVSWEQLPTHWKQSINYEPSLGALMILPVWGAGGNNLSGSREVLIDYPFASVIYQLSPNPKDLGFNYTCLTPGRKYK